MSNYYELLTGEDNRLVGNGVSGSFASPNEVMSKIVHSQAQIITTQFVDKGLKDRQKPC
ncbi:hypothetical protein [Marinicella sp. W31]|uniref:hypothetical protein n=1 Tax=Marinicella sp. W31 TaxID=3023713 RepID=UPI003756F4B1